MSPAKPLAAVFLLICCGCGSRGLYSRAEEERYSGNLALARKDTQRGFDRWSAQPNSPWHWRFKLLLAEILSSQDPDKTAELLAADLPQGIKDRGRLEVRLLTDRAYLHLRKAEYPEASSLGDRAYTGALRDAPDLIPDILVLRAGVSIRAGELDQGVGYIREAIVKARESGNRYSEANALGQMGALLFSRSHFDEAISVLSQSFAISRTAGYEAVSGLTANNLGWCYFRLGDFERAAAYYKESNESSIRTGNLRTRHVALSNLGTIHLTRGEYREAIADFERALTISKKMQEPVWIGRELSSLAIANIENGDLDAADRYVASALEAKSDDPDVNERVTPLLISAAIAHARKDYAVEMGLYHKILAASPSDPSIQWQVHAGLGQVYAAEENIPQARAEYGHAVGLIDSSWAGLQNDSSKLTFPAGVSRFYRQYMDFLVSRNLAPEALEFGESRRALLLSEKIGAAPAGSDFTTLARRLDAVLLSYWMAPAQSYMWITTPARTLLVKLPPEAKIRSLVEQYSKAIQANRGALTEDPAGRELYDILIRPAAEFLRQDARVILVPDGTLHRLNFETIPTPGGRYWVQDVTVEIVPSLRLMAGNAGQGDLHASAQSSDSILLIGDPNYGADLPKLPYAAEEIRGIAQLFPKPKVITGPDAQPGAYQAAAPGNFPVIHFAAHALGNRENPLDSAVALSPGPNGSRLYAREIEGTTLNADLVTISACRSAGERAYSGEGLVGFAWAFLSAGARTVVASLWDVNDRSTADFMRMLYEKVRDGQRPASALRAVKIGFLNSGTFRQKPYYWAPFQAYAR